MITISYVTNPTDSKGKIKSPEPIEFLNLLLEREAQIKGNEEEGKGLKTGKPGVKPTFKPQQSSSSSSSN